MGDAPVVGVLPFRGLDDPKTRLREVLSPGERRTLALALLARATRALHDGGIAHVAVVTLDARMAELEPGGWDALLVQPRPGINRAIRAGQEWALAQGARALLVVLPDLPLLAGEDVRAILAAGEGGGAVVAPDRHGQGTNALLLAPPDAIAPAFGAGSARRHRLGLALADVPTRDVQRPATQLDLDTADDIHRLATLGHDLSALVARDDLVPTHR